jgi:hypothetical protein
METNSKSTRVEGLLSLFDMHTTFFERAVEGIAPADLTNRLGTKANHMSWLCGALVAQRFLMASEIRPDLQQNGSELFKNNRGIREELPYPSASEYLEDWRMISPFARQALVDVSDERLDSIIDMGGMMMTWFEMVSFSIYREANMIGQLALWRRLLGYPALRYGEE